MRKRKKKTQRTPRGSAQRPEGYFADDYKDPGHVAFERKMGKRLQPKFRPEIERRIREIDSRAAEGVDAFEALKRM